MLPGSLMLISLRKHNQKKLHLKRDFQRIFRQGRRVSTTNLSMRFVPNQLGYTRLAVIAPKRLGKAVIRNKVKRRIKDMVFNRRYDQLAESLDIAIILGEKTAGMDYWQLDDELTRLLSKAGILRS